MAARFWPEDCYGRSRRSFFLFTVSYPANDILRPDEETATFLAFLAHVAIALTTAVVVFAIVIPWALRREPSGAVAFALSIIGTFFFRLLGRVPSGDRCRRGSMFAQVSMGQSVSITTSDPRASTLGQ